ncbi:hypothetical protein CFS9_03220 [Flavobacterium sp. CFS9]|uniref:Uncharacterized protein n=1 Tax=Flavobacterium sp. CFS9 TaxID=3143118 RepID=A0AAT9GWS0_9FLAO
MDVIEKLTVLLTGKTFSHNGKKYCFQSCKKVVSNIMILTNKETIQVPMDRFVDFYEKVEKNCFDTNSIPEKQTFMPTELLVKQPTVFVPEMSSTYQKLNVSFDVLIGQIDNATNEDISFLETKAKMLTSVAQTAIGMENSRVNLIKIFQGK